MNASIRHFTILSILVFVLSCSPQKDMGNSTAQSTLHTEEVTYSGGGITMKGYLAYDKTQDGPRPGVLIVHEWWGHDDYVRRRADMLAELGYVAFAVDMYGEGKNTEHPDEAQAFMMEAMNTMDNAFARFSAAKEYIDSLEVTDQSKTAAIGYCFGGATVLNAARVGVDLDAVVSFHGALASKFSMPETNGNTKILVLNGAADTLVSAEHITAFKQEMDNAGADYEFISYPGVKHSFTNPAATEIGKKIGLPLVYDADADADSWARMQTLFNEVF